MKPARRVVLLASLIGIAGLAGLAVAPSWAADPAIDGNGPIAGPARASLAWHGPRDRRVVALTFDDGYAPWNVRRIVGILREEGVRATFFLNGVYMRRDPALWRAIGQGGHAIGNHTYLHRDATRMSPDRLIADLLHNQRVVEAATGRPMAPIFRPPYGRRSAATDAAAAAAGFPSIVMWDTSAADATYTPRARTSIRSATRGRPGSIVLFHAGPSLTPRILREVIQSYRDRGFGFVTVPELLGLPAAAGRPAPGTPLSEPDDAACRGRDPRLECGLGDAAVPAAPPGDDLGAPASDDEAGASTVAAGGAGPAAPAPRRSPVPDLPPARAAAWARGQGAETAVAVLTVGLLAGLLVVGALAGRRRSPGGADPARSA